MSDYIERDAVTQMISEWADGYSYIEVPTEWAEDEVRKIPAADVAPVVRCRECKHFVISEGVCALHSNNYEPPVYCGDEDFCSWGRRKERKGGAER